LALAIGGLPPSRLILAEVSLPPLRSSVQHTDGSFARLELQAVASTACSKELSFAAAVKSTDRSSGLRKAQSNR